MLNSIRNAVFMAAAGYAGEKLWDAGQRGFRAFQAARADRRASGPAVNLNAAGEGPVADLRPFRVEVLARGGSAAVAVHNIYALCADEASSWALSHYDELKGNIRIIVREMH